MHHLVTAEGTPVTYGRSHHCVVAGPHQGTHWRIDDLLHNGTEWLVRASRTHRAGRVHRTFSPSVFALEVREELTRARHALNAVHHTWQRIDEWLLAGVFALIPLGLVEPEIGHRLLMYVGLGGE